MNYQEASVIRAMNLHWVNYNTDNGLIGAVEIVPVPATQATLNLIAQLLVQGKGYSPNKHLHPYDIYIFFDLRYYKYEQGQDAATVLLADFLNQNTPGQEYH
jgi:hypothetical protein